jgi:HK97 family phage portal protein
MKVFGFEIFRATPEHAAAEEPAIVKQTTPTSLAPASSVAGSGWWPVFGGIREAFSGAWQRNIATPFQDVLAFSAVFSCVTLIATDIAKMRARLVAEDADGVTRPVPRGSQPAVLSRPNHYQLWIQFIAQWLFSKLLWGNAYVLKERDGRGAVTALYILDPARCRPLVATNGDVYYALSEDVLAGITAGIPAIPASEIIHDVMYAFFHPLVGLSPIYACGLAAVQGLRIQTSSAKFFQQGSALGGVLTAPGAISDETAKRLKEFWDGRFAGSENAGRIAILGDGLKFESMTMRSTDAQLIEQLRWTAENVATAYHVPAFKIGVGTMPAYAANAIESLDQQYYSQCLQHLIESIEALLDDGLSFKAPQHIEFNLDDLLRMDSATLVDVQAKAVAAGIATPNEARRRLNLPPVAGGNTPYLQQQMFSLAALDARDRANPAPSTLPAAGGAKP